MEHVRSTLATTAVAVLGLVVAARVLHPGNFEELPKPTRSSFVQAATIIAPAPAPVPTTAWVDPPSDLNLHPSAAMSETYVLAPRMTALLPAGVTMASILPAEMAAAPDRPRKITAARRSKAVQRAARAKQNSPVRDQTATAEPTAARPLWTDPLDASSGGLGVESGRRG